MNGLGRNMLILDVAGDETGLVAVDSSFSVLCVAFKTFYEPLLPLNPKLEYNSIL
jgi:hypothetical protein